MMSDQKAIQAINKHEWFHVRPYAAPACYQERGRFYAATYPKAVGYGKPFLYPDRISVARPLIGEDEATDITLFGKRLGPARSYRDLCWQEARRKRRAQKLGYDAILLLPEGSIERFYKTLHIPGAAELCLIDLTLSVGPASAEFCTSEPRFLSIPYASTSYTGMTV